jgi:ankyrin repeat protein
MVVDLLGKGANPAVKGDQDRTALMEAAWGGHTEMMHALFAKEADVNTKDQLGRTPLIEATLIGNRPDIVQTLIDKGADVNARDKQGWTPLIVAALRGHANLLDLFLAKGARVDARDDLGGTALIVASS